MQRNVQPHGKRWLGYYPANEMGLFFCNDDPTKLQAVFAELEPSNYLLENIYQMEDVSFWTLHASKTEILTPEKLFKRNIAFNALADYCEINRYDGWDVERITSAH